MNSFFVESIKIFSLPAEPGDTNLDCCREDVDKPEVNQVLKFRVILKHFFSLFLFPSLAFLLSNL